jgi:hypothetical protein
MFIRARGAAIAVAALLVTSTVMYAAGNWSTLPVVGYSSYCASIVSGTGGLGGITGTGQGTTGSICAQTVPAGPSITQGTEVFPVDAYNPSNLTPTQGGTSPTTYLISLASLNALPPAYPQFSANTATNTFTVSPLVGVVILSATSGLLSSTTMTFPAAPIDGQQLRVSSTGTITTFAVSANVGQSSNNNPTVITASTTTSYGYAWIFRAATSAWSRIQ